MNQISNSYATARVFHSGSPSFKQVSSPNVGRRSLLPQNSLFERRKPEDQRKSDQEMQINDAHGSQRKGASTHLERVKRNSFAEVDPKSQSSVAIKAAEAPLNYGRNGRRIRSIDRPRNDSPVHTPDYQEWRQMQL
jgi:hypothetical protein